MTAEEDATTWAQESLDDEALDADDPWAQFTPQAAAPGGALPDSVTDYPTDGNMTNTPVSAFDTYIGNPAASGHNRLRESLHALQAPGFNASDEERAIWATRAADLSRQTDNYRPTGEMADKLSKVAEAKGFTDGVEALWDNPEILVPVIVESFTMFAPALAGTALAGATVGPVGTAIGAGLGSSSLEFAATLTQEMAKAGGDPTDPMAWNRVLKDPKIMHAAYKKAAIRGAVIGSFDTVTAGLAGKMLAASKGGIISPIILSTAEVLMQMGGGGLGEATAMVASGDEFKHGEWILEAVAEGPTAAIEVPANIKSARQAAGLNALQAGHDAAQLLILQEEMDAATLRGDGAEAKKQFDAETDYFYGKYGKEALARALAGPPQSTQDPVAQETQGLASSAEASAIPGRPDADPGGLAEEEFAIPEEKPQVTGDLAAAVEALSSKTPTQAEMFPTEPEAEATTETTAAAVGETEQSALAEAAAQATATEPEGAIPTPGQAEPAVAEQAPGQPTLIPEEQIPATPEPTEDEAAAAEAAQAEVATAEAEAAAQVEAKKAERAEYLKEPAAANAPRKRVQDAFSLLDKGREDDKNSIPKGDGMAGAAMVTGDDRRLAADSFWLLMKAQMDKMTEAGYDTSTLREALARASGSASGRAMLEKKGSPISGQGPPATQNSNRGPKGGWKAKIENLYTSVEEALEGIRSQPEPAALPDKRPLAFANNNAWKRATDAGIDADTIRTAIEKPTGPLKVGDVTKALAKVGPTYDAPAEGQTSADAVEVAADTVDDTDPASEQAEGVEDEAPDAMRRAQAVARIKANYDAVTMMDNRQKGSGGGAPLSEQDQKRKMKLLLEIKALQESLGAEPDAAPDAALNTADPEVAGDTVATSDVVTSTNAAKASQVAKVKKKRRVVAKPAAPAKAGDLPVFTGKTHLDGDSYGASVGGFDKGNRRQLMRGPSGDLFWGDYAVGHNRDTGLVITGEHAGLEPAQFPNSKAAREAAADTPQTKTQPEAKKPKAAPAAKKVDPAEWRKDFANLKAYVKAKEQGIETADIERTGANNKIVLGDVDRAMGRVRHTKESAQFVKHMAPKGSERANAAQAELDAIEAKEKEVSARKKLTLKDLNRSDEVSNESNAQPALFENVDVDIAEEVFAAREMAGTAITEFLASVDSIEARTRYGAKTDVILAKITDMLHPKDPWISLLQLMAEQGSSDISIITVTKAQMAKYSPSGEAIGLMTVQVPKADARAKGKSIRRRILLQDLKALAGREEGPGTALLTTLMHELTHAYTAASMTTDNKFAMDIESLRKEAIAFVDKHPGILNTKKKPYGFQDAEEFLAEALSNVEFQRMLAMIPTTGRRRNLLGRMFDRISELFGLVDTFDNNATADTDNILAAVLSLAPDVFTDSRLQQTLWPEIIDKQRTSIRRADLDPEPEPEPAMTQEEANELMASFLDDDTSVSRERLSGSSNDPSVTQAAGVLLKALRGKAHDVAGIDLAESGRFAGRALLGFTTTDQLVRRFKPMFQDGAKNLLQAYHNVTRHKVQMARSLQQKAEHINQQWGQLEKLGKDRADAFAVLLHDATLAELHPDLAFANTKNKHAWKDKSKQVAHAKLKARFNSAEIGPQGRALYRTVSKFYTDQRLSLRRAAMKHIADVWDVPNTLGIKQYTQILNANSAADIKAIDFSALGTNANMVQTALAGAATMNSVKGPYFPLRRFGKYVVEGLKLTQRVPGTHAKRSDAYTAARDIRANDPTVKVRTRKDANGGGYYNELREHVVEMHDSISEAEDAAADLIKKGYTSARAGKPLAPGLKARWKMPPQVGANDVLAMAKRKFDPASAEAKALDTAFVDMLLDTNVRKSEQPRKKRAGASMDMRRAFAERAYAGSWQLADITTAMDHRTAMQSLKNHAVQNVKAQEVVRELELRDDLNLVDRAVAAWEGKLSKLGFVWFLASPSYSVVNLTQVPLVAQPYLGGKYGQAKAAKELYDSYAKVVKAAGKEWANIKGGVTGQTAENVLDKVKNTFSSDEQVLIDTLTNMGIMDATFAQELYETSRGRNENTLTTVTERVMNIARTTPQVAELVNRAVVARTAYRLARNAGGDVNTATEAAAEAIYKTQFDYSDLNKPRFFKFTGGRAIMMFKMYAQGMYALLASNAIGSFKGDNKAESRKVLAGLIASHSLMGGIFGGLFIEPARVLISIAAALLEDEDDPWDMEYEITAFLAELVGAGAAELITRGIPRAIGIDLSSRVGLNNMAFMDVRESRSYEDAWKERLVSVLGPLAGAVGAGARGMDYMSKGEYVRGIEGMVPKGIRDVIKAPRLLNDGLRDYNTKRLLGADTYNWYDTLVQGVGFQTAKTARVYEERIPQQKRDTKLRERRKKLMQMWRRADNKAEFFREKIRPFNLANRTRRITRSGLRKSQVEVRRAERQGVYPTKDRDIARMGRAYQ
tara:strand:+ start:1476 stop:8789 length:7314 start_codon:yes stop_codon:yes gene_type:complete